MSWAFAREVFILHSPDDADLTRALGSALEREGFEVLTVRWQLRREIPWQDHLSAALDRAGAGIVVLSAASRELGVDGQSLAPFVQSAHNNGRPLIAVVREDDDSATGLQQEHVVVLTPRPDERSGPAWQSTVREIADRLRAAPPRTSIQPAGPPSEPIRRRRPRLASRALLFLSLSMPLALASIVLFISASYTSSTAEAAERTHQYVQEIERSLSDPGIRLVDIRGSDRRLERREIYDAGSLIAYDEFQYAGDVPLGKTRTYVRENGFAYLKEEFALDGLVISRTVCPETSSASCYKVPAASRSPLPPLGIMLYR